MSSRAYRMSHGETSCSEPKGLVRMKTKFLDEIEKVSQDFHRACLDLTMTPILAQLKYDQRVQIVSRLTSKALQIVNGTTSQEKELNACGELGPNDNAAHWKVRREGKATARFHNGPHFIAISNGHTHIATYYELEKAGPETLIDVDEYGRALVRLRCDQEKSCMVGVMPDGSLLRADNTSKDDSTQFLIKEIDSQDFLTKKTSEKGKQLSRNQYSNAFSDLNNVDVVVDEEEPDRYWGGGHT